MAVSSKQTGQTFQHAVLAHRATLDRLLDRRGVLGLKRYFDQAQDRLERALARLSRGSRSEALTPIQAQQLLAVVRQTQQQIATRLAQGLRPVLTEAQGEGVDQADATITELERKFTGGIFNSWLTETSTRERLRDRRAAILDRANGSAWVAFGSSLVVGVSESLAASLALSEEPQDAIQRVRATADKAWGRAERVIRTEMAYAYNQAQADSIAEVARGLEGLGKRWCELVDDATGLPFDERVGNDSLVLHGQVVEASGLFVMPADPSVHRSFWNQSWESSPNRPNDRSVTLPWRPAWGVPGYRLVGGMRVPVNRAG